MRPSGLLFSSLALAAMASFAGAQQVSQMTTAKVRLLSASGSPLPIDFVIVRDAEGNIVDPQSEPFGQYAFRSVGRKATFEFAKKGLKVPGVEVMLEEAPVVYVSMVINPITGEVKWIHQKAVRPHPRLGKGAFASKNTGTGQTHLIVPSNDDCANALPIFDGSTAYSTIDATTDGAPDPNGQYDGQTYNDIWFIYTPTCNGTLTVSTMDPATDYDTDLAIYEADADGDLDHDAADCALITSGAELPLVSNDDAGFDFKSEAATTVQADHQYIIRVGGAFSTDAGNGRLLISCGGAPSNDICTAPRELICGTSLNVTNIAATTAVGDPAFSCTFNGTQGAGTLWFRFTATDTSALITTNGSQTVTDTILAVYDGSCGSLVELGCDDDGGDGALSSLCVSGLTIGHSYLVEVASFPGFSDPGRITMNLECPGPCGAPPCDDVDAACDLVCGTSVTIDNSFASLDPADPLFSCGFFGPATGEGSVWFKFVATATSAKLDTNSSAVSDTLLAVYSGSPGSLVEIGCSEDEGAGFLSELCVEGLTIGQTYYVQVASFSAASLGSITLAIECPCGAGVPGDICDTAISVPVPSTFIVDLTGATDDITVPCDPLFSGPFQNLWYKVIGTGGTMTATTCSPNTLITDTKMSVLCGDCSEPVCVTANDDDCNLDSGFRSTVTWCSQAGAEYLITVGKFSSFTSGSIIELSVFESNPNACVAAVQCLPTGACCLSDGSCVTVTADDCAIQGGTYNGDGTACTSEFVTDGSFEAGAFGGTWSEFSSTFGTPVCDGSCGFGGGTGPRTGVFWTWFGGAPGIFEEGSMEQAVTIPVGATDLTFYLEIPVSSGNATDFVRVKIDAVTVFEALENDVVYAGVGYKLVTVPIGAFADGGVHTLRFESVQTGTTGISDSFSNFFVDDVSLLVQTFNCEQCVTLDFQTEDDFSTPLGNGQTITTPPEFGNLVSISAAGANAGAAIFNSQSGGPNDPSQDRDLLVNRGNVLILQNSQVPAQTGGFFNTPNDDQDGGDLIFTFLSPVATQSVVLIDIDVGTNQASSVVLTDSNGKTRTYTVPSQWTEDIIINGGSGWRTLDLTTLAPQPGFASVATATEQAGFDGSSVVKMKVHLGSSGAVDDVTFCQ